MGSLLLSLCPHLRKNFTPTAPFAQVASLKCMGSLLVHRSTRGVLPEEDMVAAVVLHITSLARFSPNLSPKEVAV